MQKRPGPPTAKSSRSARPRENPRRWPRRFWLGGVVQLPEVIGQFGRRIFDRTAKQQQIDVGEVGVTGRQHVARPRNLLRACFPGQTSADCHSPARPARGGRAGLFWSCRGTGGGQLVSVQPNDLGDAVARYRFHFQPNFDLECLVVHLENAAAQEIAVFRANQVRRGSVLLQARQGEQTIPFHLVEARRFRSWNQFNALDFRARNPLRRRE